MTPRLVDLQVNGYAGVDFNDAGLTAAGLDHALAAMRADGVAACLPTLITAPAEALAARFAALDRAVGESGLGPAMVPGYHLEGPFLSPEPGYAGCHPPAAMVPPDPALVAGLEAPLARPILLLTLAPERPGAAELIRWAAGRGKLVAIGHSAAAPEDIVAAAAAGARLSTHLGNALFHTQHKFRNPMMAQLAEDRLAASFIADGLHIPPFALGVLLRAKGLARSLLVSDATAAAAAPAGRYRFAGMDIVRGDDGTVRLAGGTTLAGSALRLCEAVRNVTAWGFATAAEAERMAADTPAALLAPAVAAHGLGWTVRGDG
ncbi:MAG: N-acetylglucosamine-6-phosphate deacetylase [Rhodospirillales bacterium]|nr:N-acetylglucosamine-6-phosphate deacetylase [Rhodospirillales bacterium]